MTSNQYGIASVKGQWNLWKHPEPKRYIVIAFDAHLSRVVCMLGGTCRLSANGLSVCDKIVQDGSI